MRARLWALALLAALSTADHALADEIQPDRPELTDSAKLVPVGSVQLEAGVALARTGRGGAVAEHTLGIEATLRIGAARHLELDLEGEPFVRVRGPRDDTGFDEVTLGLRYRLVQPVDDQDGLHVAVKPFVRLPVAGEPIGSGRPDAGLLLLLSFALPGDLELEVNAGGAAIGQTRPRGFMGQAVASAALSRDLAASVLGFVELLLNTAPERDDRGQVATNIGLVYRVTPDLTLDAAMQASLLGRGPDYVGRVGLSVRFCR
jgi:outer membrane putative beta-barrel porin/alpha-amylase